MMLIKNCVRYLYAPLFFVGFIAFAIIIIENGNGIHFLIPLFFLALFVSFLAEFLVPYEAVWNYPKGDMVRDIIHAFVNETSTFISVSMIPILSIVLPKTGIWPTQWPIYLQIMLAVLMADFGITITHYASHKLSFLWRLHAVHHSVERMYGFNGLMKHPLHQLIETVAGVSPLLLLGLPQDIAALLGFAVAIQLMLQHSNVDMRIGPFVYLWAVAPGHRHHHVASETEGDVNFGLFTMLWDHMLGTFVCNRPTPKDGELGIAGERAYPVSYYDQLLRPFRSK